MSGGRPPGTKNSLGHDAGGSREGSGRKNTARMSESSEKRQTTSFQTLPESIILPGML